MTAKATALITPAQLAKLQADGAVSIFDCRFDLTDPEAGGRAYAAEHIPTAVYADLDRVLSAPSGPADGRHPLPDRDSFCDWLGQCGVTPGRQVVTYDDGPGAFAARLWWLLRWVGHEEVAVLNGGLKGWRAAGLPLTSTPPRHRDAGRYPARQGLVATVSAAEVPAALTAGRLLVDVRDPQRYSGQVEPLDPVAGHIPGAVNYPFQNHLDAEGGFLPPKEIQARLEELLVDRDADQVIAMCGSGVTACHLLLTMEAAGLTGAALYPGSWSEWIRDPQRPVARGSRTAGTA